MCVKKGGAKKTVKNQSAMRQRRAGRKKEGKLHQRWGRGKDRRKGGEIAEGSRLAAVRGRVIYFLKIHALDMCLISLAGQASVKEKKNGNLNPGRTCRTFW